jgi:hypothetical protein
MPATIVSINTVWESGHNRSVQITLTPREREREKNTKPRLLTAIPDTDTKPNLCALYDMIPFPSQQKLEMHDTMCPVSPTPSSRGKRDRRGGPHTARDRTSL